MEVLTPSFIESINSNNFNSLIHVLYAFKMYRHTTDSIRVVEILDILSRKLNQYPSICCSIWYDLAGFHLDSCVNKMDVYK